MSQRQLSIDERVFTTADVKKLFVRQKKKIIRASWIGAVVTFIVFLLKTPPSYLITATFRDSKGDSGGSSAESFQKMLGGAALAVELQAAALMQSHQVLRPLVERMGLQVEIPKKSFFGKLYRRIRDNLLAEAKRSLREVDWFSFRNVLYQGEQPLQYTLQFEDSDHFSILSGKKLVAKGVLNSEVLLPDAQLTLTKVPKNVRLAFPYPLSIRPWVSAVQDIQSRFQIRNQKPYRSIFVLSFTHRDRHFGRELLNALMEEYRSYLKRDHTQVAKEQLVYLEEKQEEICGRMLKTFDEYTTYLQENLSESGQLGLQQEIAEMAQEHRTIANKVSTLDLEWERLSRMEADPKTFVFLDKSPLTGTVQETLNTVAELKQQRDLIELSLPSYRTFDGEEYASRREELQEIRNRRGVVCQLLQQLEEGAPLQEQFFNPEISLEAWAVHLEQAQGKERRDLAEYLTNYTRLLSRQEKVLQEQIFHGSDLPSEFKGIDLATAQSFFKDYNQRLDTSKETMKHLLRLKVEMEDDDFEMSSLSTVLSDPLSQRLITEASEISLKLKDEKHRSEKEGNRWMEELVLKKKILKNHIDQLHNIEVLKSNLLQDKIKALQILSLNCISEQLSVMQERLSDCIKERKSSLLEEKKILENKMAQMRSQCSELPKKWRKEKWLNLRSQMGIKMVQALTELVESKTIASHLHHIESKFLDSATVPFVPIYPKLFVKTFLGAFLFGFVSFFRLFLRNVFSGFPTSSEKLRALSYPFLGEISSLCDGPEAEALGTDLELLRQISLLIGRPSQGQVIGIIEGKGPDYSYALGRHLTRMALCPLLIRCDFHVKFNSQDMPGLLQVWKQEIATLPIRKQEGYEILFSGGYTPYGTEIIRSVTFQKLLEICRQKYDCILLILRSSLDSVESISPLSLCDKAVVTVAGEPTEQLTPFLNWAYHENMCRLAFLTSGSA